MFDADVARGRIRHVVDRASARAADQPSVAVARCRRWVEISSVSCCTRSVRFVGFPTWYARHAECDSVDGVSCQGADEIGGGVTVTKRDTDVQALERLVRESPLAVGLVDLTRLRLVVASPSAGATLGRCDLDGIDVLSLVRFDEITSSVMGVMRSGAIDAYEARRVFTRPDGSDHVIHLWVRGLAAHGFGHRALVVFKTVEEAEPEVTPNSVMSHVGVPRAVAVVAGDERGRVDHIGGEIERLLAVPGDSFRAEPLYSWMHPSDAEVFRGAMRRSHAEGAAQVATVRLRTGDGGWAPFRVIVKVGDVALGSRLGVAFLPLDEDDRDDDSGVDALVGEIRALDLVDAMTYLPAAAELPALLEDLTERELEIVARLLRGDRAPTIARAIYLAPSTVRNHLTSVFRKLGVHSQQELIACFRSRQPQL